MYERLKFLAPEHPGAQGTAPLQEANSSTPHRALFTRGSAGIMQMSRDALTDCPVPEQAATGGVGPSDYSCTPWLNRPPSILPPLPELPPSTLHPLPNPPSTLYPLPKSSPAPPTKPHPAPESSPEPPQISPAVPSIPLPKSPPGVHPMPQSPPALCWAWWGVLCS